MTQATPHAVRGARAAGISRETFAVFMEPMWMELMNCPDGVDPSNAQSQSAAENLPKGVPPLASRWEPKMPDGSAQTFFDFSERTLKSYY